MQIRHSSMLATALAGLSLACEIPDGPPLSQTITEGFRIQVQNASVPAVHNKYMNLLEAGGGDQHLFIGPVGRPTYDLTLTAGIITWSGGPTGTLRANIGGEFSEIDHTTKLFMSERVEPAGVFQPTYACNPVTDELQVELAFLGWQGQPDGGWICVRPTFDDGHEFRYYPPGNTLVDVNRECIKVTLVALLGEEPPVQTSTSTTATPTSTSATTFTTVTTTTPTPTGTPEPFADMTASGWAFRGCAPEERRATDGPGRTLPARLFASDSMTNEACTAFCEAEGFAFAGSEWSRECWCDNTVAPGRVPVATWASVANCNYNCAGDVLQKCGGDAWMSLYEKCEDGEPCVNTVFT